MLLTLVHCRGVGGYIHIPSFSSDFTILQLTQEICSPARMEIEVVQGGIERAVFPPHAARL